jgi:hypothetical protein
MPELMQILEENAEYVLAFEDQKRKRPNAPGTSKRKHFERANQKRGRRDFEWSPPQEKDSHKNDPPSHEARRSRDGHHEEGNSERFTWTGPNPEPHVEPSRPAGWKPLVITPELVQLSEDAERKLADQRMKEWSKDQEEYTERQYQEVQKKRPPPKPVKDEKKDQLERCLDLSRRIRGERSDAVVLEALGKYPREMVEEARTTRLKELEDDNERVRREEEEKQRRMRNPVTDSRTNQEIRRSRVEICARIYEEASAEKSVTKGNERLDQMLQEFEKEIWEEGREIWLERERIQREKEEKSKEERRALEEVRRNTEELARMKAELAAIEASDDERKKAPREAERRKTDAEFRFKTEPDPTKRYQKPPVWGISLADKLEEAEKKRQRLLYEIVEKEGRKKELMTRIPALEEKLRKLE